MVKEIARMRKLNKKNTSEKNMEAFGLFAPCYCYCGCETKNTTRGVGQMYFGQDSKSVSNYNDGLGFWGAYDHHINGK